MSAMDARDRVMRPAGRALSRTLVLELAFLAMEALAFFVVGATVTGAAGREGASFRSTSPRRRAASFSCAASCASTCPRGRSSSPAG